MNASNAKDYLPLVQALAEGKVIQLNYSGDWKDISEMDPIFPANFYRIKPEPKEVWFNRYPSHESGPYPTKENAANCGHPDAVQVCYREVIE